VQSILFKDHEGAFLVGLIAGKIAKSGHVGFIGGMDVPLIRNFAHGYAQGVRYANPSAEIDSEMLGTTPEAWSDPDKAHALAVAQFNKGAEVIFAAAGGSGVGVLKAASETSKFAIGVDINQNGLFPQHVLTSLVKRVDVAVYNALRTSRDGKWSAGIKYLGITEGALDYAIDQHNRDLLPMKVIEDVAMAKERIINGIIVVEAYAPK
jgi:basic membrane protein A